MSHDSEMQSAASVELVAFRIGTQEYCVDIMAVREIRGWTPATILPHAPEFVMGVINLRGTVLPVIDLSARLRLGRTEPTPRHVNIVVRIEDQVVGLLVDGVSDILTLDAEQIKPAPEVGSTATRQFVKGVFAVEDRMISLIELTEVLPHSLREAA